MFYDAEIVLYLGGNDGYIVCNSLNPSIYTLIIGEFYLM